MIKVRKKSNIRVLSVLKRHNNFLFSVKCYQDKKITRYKYSILLKDHHI